MREILLNVVHEFKQNKENILVNINKHMFEKWIQSATEIFTITSKQNMLSSGQKQTGSGKEQETNEKYGGFQYIIQSMLGITYLYVFFH